MKIIASSQKALISLTLGGFECCKSCTRETNKIGADFSWFGWPDWPRNVRAQFFGRSGKVLHEAFSIVGMAYRSQYVNRAIPDDRVARSIPVRAVTTYKWHSNPCAPIYKYMHVFAKPSFSPNRLMCVCCENGMYVRQINSLNSVN